MRLHHLEVRAFGPFADEAVVDFDALSAAGLFLLSGATGAGKTSVLDAVCFALYGDVPGDRSIAKRLRSDQAAAGVAPRVVLEATVSGRRVRISRSPSWERPKLRGTGLTTQQASVVLAERIDGTWRTLSTRLDETGLLVAELVGLNLQQFCQVAMLPQGRFQAFLRARSEDRHKLLQQLFRTGRFEAAERWLRDHRATLRRTSLAHEATVADLVSRLSEVGTTTDDPPGLDKPAVVDTWAQEVLQDARRAHEEAEVELVAATAAAASAATTLTDGRDLADRQHRRSAAVRDLARLDDEEAAHRASLHRLDAATTAARAVPALDHADAAAERAAAAAAEQKAACAELEGRQLAADPESLTRTRDESLAAAAAARALLPRERHLDELRRHIAAYAARLTVLDGELDRHEADLSLSPDRIERCRRDLATATAAQARLPGARALAEAGGRQRAAVRQLAALAPENDAALADLSDAVDRSQRVTDAWLDLRERRLSEMAAEMAVGLVVGGCCPVCGSADHPSPARGRADAPDAEAERAARRLVDDAEAARHLHEEHVRDLATRRALAQQVLEGVDLAALDDRVCAAESDVSRLSTLAASTASMTAELRRLEHDAADVTRRRDAARLERSGVLSAAETMTREAAAITAEVQAALLETDDSDLASRSRRSEQLASWCSVALSAHERAGSARVDSARARAAAERSLAVSGFVDALAARAARLSETETERLATAVRRHDASRLAAEQVLLDPDLADAAAAEPPDLDLLRSTEVRARARADAATAAARAAADRDDRLTHLVGRLTEATAAWLPVRSDLETATALSAFVDGRAADNRLQMRLSAYVLAYRLAQVVDAANTRLATMSDQRYSLVHTGRRGAGENRGGLSLLVRDDWSGETRDPATLSGGETFVVSLALALGLADVITQESDSGAVGDSRLDTLFVDEGFGSLDADTLDDVMDTLDALREGGRVVGVVSHVAEMRDRIPTRLEVIKHRHGSRVRGPGSGH